MKKRSAFFVVFFTRKNCKNKAKIFNLPNIRKNAIENLEVDIATMCLINKY